MEGPLALHWLIHSLIENYFGAFENASTVRMTAKFKHLRQYDHMCITFQQQVCCLHRLPRSARSDTGWLRRTVWCWQCLHPFQVSPQESFPQNPLAHVALLSVV